MRITIFLLIYFAIFASCNKKIPSEKLTVIENITLGGPSNTYKKQFDSLQIPYKSFFSEIFIAKINDLSNNNNYYTSYYTELFNFSEYINTKYSVEHLGLISPISLRGTQNNFALIVLLCHTTEPWLFGEAANYKNTITEKLLRQEVNNELIDKIKKMYITKYGPPKSIDTTSFNTFWMIEGNSFSKKNNDASAITVKWETEYYNITFFTVSPSGVFTAYT